MRRRPVDPPGLLARAVHLFALWGFAVAQPLFDLLGRKAQFFVAHDITSAEIVGLALMLVVLPPALLALSGWVASRAEPRAGYAIHLAWLALLVAAAVLPLLKKAESLPGVVQIFGAAALGAVAAWAYRRFAVISSYLWILAPAPLVFVTVFLFLSPQASKLVRPEPLTAIDAGPVDGASERSSAQPRHPVVLVIFDELSLPTLLDATRHIDAERYPNFAALAQSSHWFRNATATADNTVLALPAILTGRYLGEGQRKVRLATYSSYPENLFRLLGGSYSMNVFESVTHLCPREICGSNELDLSPARRLRYLAGDLSAVYLHLLLPPEQTAWLPAVDQQWAHFALFEQKKRKRSAWAESDRKIRYFEAFQRALRAEAERSQRSGGDGSALHFLHGDLPHVPWCYLPSGKNYGTLEDGLCGDLAVKGGRWTQDHWSVKQGFQRYLLQLGLVDRLLGDLLLTLEETGLYDRALVVVTADHGVSFRPGGQRRKADRQNFADIMSVPLFIKLPGQNQGQVSDRNVELVDILPTILDVVGLEAPWSMDGASVFANSRERPRKRLFRGPNKTRGKLILGAAALEARYKSTQRMIDLFGPSSDPLALYRIGPSPALIGRPLAELDVKPKARFQVRLKRPEVYEEVDPASGFVPARVVASIRPLKPQRRPLNLAVAVGDKVWATTRAARSKLQWWPFSAIVPEIALKPGPNQVRVFVIEGTRERPRLIPTRLVK